MISVFPPRFLRGEKSSEQGRRVGTQLQHLYWWFSPESPQRVLNLLQLHIPSPPGFSHPPHPCSAAH